MKHTKLYDGIFDSILKSQSIFDKMNFGDSVLNSITKSQSIFDKMNFGDSVLNSITKSQSIFNKMNFGDSVLNSITKSQSIFNKMNFGDSVLNSITKSQSFFDKMKLSVSSFDFAANSNINNQLNQIISNIDIAQNSVLAAILDGDDVVSNHAFLDSKDSIAEKLDQIQEMMQSLANQPNQTTDVHKKFIVYVIIVYFITQIFIPQMNSLTVNLYTPYVQRYFGLASEKNTSESNFVVNQLVTDSTFRYVSVDGLNLRIGPTKKANKISTLNAGTLVIVLEKRKSWIKIETKINDCKIQGWAYTRYIKRFK
jgi:hypothetical protein